MRDDPTPGPEPEALELSRRLVAHIAEEIDHAGGAIDFDRYMELALYAPGLGYYSAGAEKFGASGDFVTAPELSPIFAACLADTVAAVLSELPGSVVLEAGAGSGRLAGDLLRELERLGQPPIAYLVVERSATLRERQAAHLARCGVATPVRWLDRPPTDIRGVVVANELLDALPARRFVLTAGGPLEVQVGVVAGQLAWLEAPASGSRADSLDALAEAIGPVPYPYRGEIGEAAAGWVRTFGDALRAGAMLLADYGYPRAELYHPQRVDGTLSCHYRHRRHDDPFVWPGLQDISVHVDFTAIALAAAEVGLELAGFTSQAEYLLATGALERLAAHPPGSPEALRAVGAMKQLLLPGEMGESVKVAAFARGLANPLPGFGRRDRSHRLA